MIQILVNRFIRDAENINDARVRQKYGQLAGTVGIACNFLLFLLKLAAGMMTGAVSVMADAFNNLSDAGSSVVTMIGFYMAGKPADPEHPFGHGRIEYLSGLFVAVAILLMGFELLKSSAEKILHPQALEFRLISVIILAAAIGTKLWLAYFNQKLGNRISSEAMKATAADSLSDCVSTAAVLAGILIYYFFHLNLDGYIGAVVAVLVLIAGYHAVKDTIQPLLGSAPDPEIVTKITKIVLEEPIILGIHDMIIHDYGPGRRMVSLHAEVSYDVDILEAHDVIDNIEQKLAAMFQYEVTIHMDPVITDDAELQNVKEMVTKLVKEENPDWKIHDLRMVRGNTHTNVIFDLVVSGREMMRAKEIESGLKKKIHEKNPHYYAVIKVEQSYV
ncbi:MAG: cation diffusion facilitator family transporter [Lachnospiraceae bacterium]